MSILRKQCGAAGARKGSIRTFQHISQSLAAFSLGVFVAVTTLAFYPAPAQANTALPALEAPPPELAPFEDVLASAGALFDAYAMAEHDIEELLFTLGTQAGAAFEFVRDEIRTEPYAGSLRGPQAVLAARGGNTQDKAELLAYLLGRLGLEARIATAPMPDGHAAAMAGGVCAGAGYHDANAAQLGGLIASDLTRLYARAARDYRLLTDALPGDMAATRPAATSPGDTHYWVQWRQADGSWQDLDPSLTSHNAGDALAAPADLTTGGADPHMIKIAIMAEELVGDRLRTRELLRQELTAREAATRQIQIGFTPEGAGTGNTLAKALGEVVGTRTRAKPLVFIDDEVTDGKLFAVPGPRLEGGLADDTGALTTAVWLELTTEPFGAQARTVRRMLIDLVDPAARRAGTPTEADLATPEPGTALPLALEGIQTIIASTGGLDRLSAATGSLNATLSAPRIVAASQAAELDPGDARWSLWLRGFNQSVLAEALLRAMPADADGACAYIDRPRLFVFSAGATEGQNTLSTDWANDSVAIAGPAGPGGMPDGTSTLRQRLWYGALQSALETTLVERETSFAEPGAQVFSTSLLLSGPLVEDPGVTDTGGDMAARDAQAGFILLSGPQDPGTPRVWWRVDPATGATDARVAGVGNANYYARYSVSKIGGYGGYGQGTVDISRDVARMERQQAAKIRNMGARQARAARPALSGRSSAANEYLFTLVLIALNIVGVMAIGIMIYVLWFQSLYGYRPGMKPAPPPPAPE